MPRGKKDPEYIGKPPEAVRAFQSQRTIARRRGIPFRFSFTEWWEWWQTDNRWANRGVGKGKFVMARKGDKGPYSSENVYCATHEQNGRDIASETQSRSAKSAWINGTANTPLMLRGAGNPSSRPVKTPDGIFDSATLAAKHYGFTRQYAAYLANTDRHGWRWADETTSDHSEEPVRLDHPEQAEVRESILIEMELRRERNRRRSETMKARAAAKRAERLSPSPMALDEADAASGGRITQQINDQELQQEPRRRVKKGRAFEGMIMMAVSTSTSE